VELTPALTASNWEAAFAWRAPSGGDFALCVRGTRGCVALVLLIFAGFALRSLLPFPSENRGAGTDPSAVSLELPPASGPRRAPAVIPLA